MRSPRPSSFQPSVATRLEDRVLDVDTTYGPNYGRSIGYAESRRRSFGTPSDFPAGTQKVKVLFDIDREAFWNLYSWFDDEAAPARPGVRELVPFREEPSQ